MTTTPDGSWGSYALGLLHDVQVGDAVVEYLRRIDSTLAPFGGRFLVHGGAADQVEGEAVGDVVVIGFPDATGASDWYHSAPYQAIAGLRTANSRSRVVLLPGVDRDHLATDVLAEIVAT